MGQQLVLESVFKEVEVNGVEMGVLRDGTPYLSSRGLARLCGVVPSAVINQVAAWDAGNRDSKLARFFNDHGYTNEHVYLEVGRQKSEGRAHSEQVCMLFLEYYAFVADRPSKQAEVAFRNLARAGFRVFVWGALGYTPPSAKVPDAWRHFHDRMLLQTAPMGFFSVFKETADFVLASIREGMPVDQQTIPDISVGQMWSKYWQENNLEEAYGARQRFEHNYPDDYPQAKSNPQEIHVYPVDAVGAFRRWMHTDYIPNKFPSYLATKVKQGVMTTSVAELLIASSVVPELPPAKP